MLYFIILIAVISLLVICGLVYQQLGLRADQKHFPAPGRLIDVGSYRLHLYETGMGSPSVILESGISASSLNWRRVQSEVEKFTRVCSYDRAGLGWSDLGDPSCTPGSLAIQLRLLLQRAEVSPPYILVGHSFGGLIVRSFATRFPKETAGIVLVDPLDPAEWTPLSDERQRVIAHGIRLSRRGAVAAKMGVVRLCLNLLIGGRRLLPRMAAKAWSGRASRVTDRIAGQVRKMPEETWPLVASHWKQSKCFEGMARHFECLPESIREMADTPPLSTPVTMLVGSQNDHPADPRLHARKISTDIKFIFAENSGHWIQLDQPELVVKSICEMIERVHHKSVSPIA